MDDYKSTGGYSNDALAVKFPAAAGSSDVTTDRSDNQTTMQLKNQSDSKKGFSSLSLSPAQTESKNSLRGGNASGSNPNNGSDHIFSTSGSQEERKAAVLVASFGTEHDPVVRGSPKTGESIIKQQSLKGKVDSKASKIKAAFSGPDLSKKKLQIIEQKIIKTNAYSDMQEKVGDEGMMSHELNCSDDSIAKQSSISNTKSGISTDSSTRSDDGIIVQWIKRYEVYKKRFFASDYYAMIFQYSTSSRVLIIFYQVLQLITYGLLIVGVKIVMGIELPDMNVFNLIHSLFGIIGKFAFYLSYLLSEQIRISYVAYELVAFPFGVPLTTVAMPTSRLNPNTGKTLRILCYLCGCILEVCIWLIGYFMEWQPVSGFIGTFQCNQAIYTKKPVFVDGIGDYLQGSNQFAIFYNYGLPLGDGIVGGFAQWPNQVPDRVTKFTVGGPGVIFAVGSLCDPPEVANTSLQNNGLEFKIWNENKWHTIYSLDISVQFPAGSHNYQPALGYDVIQNCQTVVTAGNANMLMEYSFDEFLNSNSGNVLEIHVGNLVIKQNMLVEGNAYVFSNVAYALGVNGSLQGSEITSWIGEGIVQIFNNATYYPTQSGSYANIFEWGTNTNGIYDIAITQRGIAAAVGSVARYILMQYDPNFIGPCDYYGMAGIGQVQTTENIKTIVILSVSLCITMQIAQLFWWILNCQSGPIYDRAARILSSPLRLLYDFRHASSNLLTEMDIPGIGDVNLEDYFATVMVKFGEDRQTRGEEVGRVILDTPKKVFPMNKKRNYEG